MDEKSAITKEELLGDLINSYNFAHPQNMPKIDEDTRKGILCSQQVEEMLYNSQRGLPKIMRESVKRQRRKK